MTQKNPMLLKVDSLFAGFCDGFGLKNIDFALPEGGRLGIVGESGSGKSLLSKLILGLSARLNCKIESGAIQFLGEDLLALKDIKRYLRKEISYIPQNCFDAQSPLKKLKEQFMETLKLAYPSEDKKALEQKIFEAFGAIGLDTSLLSRYPFELSGGENARMLILQNILKAPKILICDEPTTALDPKIQKRILDFLFSEAKRHNIAVIFITHDIELLKDYVNEVLVMQSGQIVEKNSIQNIFSAPRAEYTRLLVDSITLPKKRLKPSKQEVLSVKKLNAWSEKKGLFKTTRKHLVWDGNLELYGNEILGIIGESGSGKSSFILAIMDLLKREGEVSLGYEVTKKEFYRKVQIVLQNPFASLNPRWRVESILKEASHLGESMDGEESLARVGLGKEILSRYPFELSGGEAQRVAIARALCVRPEILILDEPTSALDKSTQKKILELLLSLQEGYGMSYIFVTHDYSIIEALCDRVMWVKSAHTKSIMNIAQFRKELALQS